MNKYKPEEQSKTILQDSIRKFVRASMDGDPFFNFEQAFLAILETIDENKKHLKLPKKLYPSVYFTRPENTSANFDRIPKPIALSYLQTVGDELEEPSGEDYDVFKGVLYPGKW